MTDQAVGVISAHAGIPFFYKYLWDACLSRQDGSTIAADIRLSP